MRTNPNGVNQYTEPDPRQSLFLEYYFDRKSKTFSNAYESAVKAGFSEEYAKVIVSNMPKWLSESIKSKSLIQKAERNLNKFLDDDKNTTIKADMTKFTLKTLGKDKGYTERRELTGKDGEKIIPIFNGQSNVSKYPSNQKDIQAPKED